MIPELHPAVAGVHVPRGMHQVLTNLLRNASDACDGRGVVTVRGGRDGDQVVLEVQDEGPGIPPETLRRVFEPFFTTKDPGKGTGLGLPISARLVEKFGGQISIECPSSGGTIVRVSLPARRFGRGNLREAS